MKTKQERLCQWCGKPGARNKYHKWCSDEKRMSDLRRYELR